MTNASDLAFEICGCASAAQNRRDALLIEKDRQQAAAEERAKIVKWLRGFATNYADDLADILEAGEHEDFTHPDNV